MDTARRRLRSQGLQRRAFGTGAGHQQVDVGERRDRPDRRVDLLLGAQSSQVGDHLLALGEPERPAGGGLGGGVGQGAARRRHPVGDHGQLGGRHAVDPGQHVGGARPQRHHPRRPAQQQGRPGPADTAARPRQGIADAAVHERHRGARESHGCGGQGLRAVGDHGPPGTRPQRPQRRQAERRGPQGRHAQLVAGGARRQRHQVVGATLRPQRGDQVDGEHLGAPALAGGHHVEALGRTLAHRRRSSRRRSGRPTKGRGQGVARRPGGSGTV